MRKFENCDVLSVLREIMSHNTKHYQTDFAIDEEILTEAANEPDAWDRRFLWMSRPCGTHCLKEKDVFLYDTSEYNTWTAYADTADEIVAYAVQLNGYEDGVLKGDLYELDYASHCAKAKNSAVYIAQVKLHCIYQLKRENYGRLFTSYHRTIEQGFAVKADDYELAYIADNTDGYDLDEIYEEFNIDRLDDFCGHSLSVSDVITYKHEDGSTEAYFVDSCGFIELTDFFGPAQKKPAQM